jgi:hypothetical protein
VPRFSAGLLNGPLKGGMQNRLRYLHQALQRKVANGFSMMRRNLETQQMKSLAALAALTICGILGCEIGAAADDQFKKLSGTEIRARFAGMEFTDQVHWGEVYESSGELKSEEMGTKRTGNWRIQKDQLCTDYGKEVGSSCYDVWMSGKNVQLRNKESSGIPLEGVLERPNR